MMLKQEIFTYVTDDKGKERPALRDTVPQGVLRAMGLLTGEAGGSDEELRTAQIPVKAMEGVRDGCVYTADFGHVEEGAEFSAPVQLVTIPCRSPTGDGHCTKTGSETPCSLYGTVATVESPGKERIKVIVAPVLPGRSLTPQQRAWLVNRREGHLKTMRQWEDTFAPVNLVLDATVRGMQFWVKSWFG
ncbi:MAG: hypothetical protein H7837_12605 [Magnetococcus sp. MYC-9]